jgi:two-component system sensor histidine kinase QseC
MIERRLDESFDDRDLKELSLRLAHSIRNPLATIKSGVQLIQRLQLDAHDANRYLTSVLHEVGRINACIGEMEGYVRLEPRSVAPVVVSSEIERVFQELEPVAVATGVHLVLDGEATVRVKADEGHVALAVQELVSNAIRFAPAATTVSIRWGRTDAATVLIEVEDRGPGVPLELEARILRPFFSTATEGSGLGLNRVIKICRMYGGRLEWLHPPEGGCRFCLHLPEA